MTGNRWCVPLLAALVALLSAFPAPRAIADGGLAVDVASLDADQPDELVAVVSVADAWGRPVLGLTGVNFAAGEEWSYSSSGFELLKETVPKVARVAVLRNPTHPVGEVFLREMQAAGRALGVRLDFFEARDPSQLGSTLSRMEKERAGALIVTPDPLFGSQRSRIVDFVARRRLPSMFFYKEFVDAGGLMAYGPSFPDSYRRAATYVDKILKGAKPADLPVEQPMRFDFVINLKTAKQIGLTIPQWTLMKATKVIQ